MTAEVTLRMMHKPGERVEIDYADGINIIDARTGEVVKTYLFLGTLPFSSSVFGEFAFSQKLTSFIESHERMWAYLGGVTPYAVVDNLKAGVHKAHRRRDVVISIRSHGIMPMSAQKGQKSI